MRLSISTACSSAAPPFVTKRAVCFISCVYNYYKQEAIFGRRAQRAVEGAHPAGKSLPVRRTHDSPWSVAFRPACPDP
jgi:hypothetical protein